MILNSNFVLKHTAWTKLKDLYPVQGSITAPKILIFKRLIDLFIVCLTIGVKIGERVPNDSVDEIASINSKTYNDPINDDLKKTLDFILKIIILTSDLKELEKLTQEQKEELAFSADYALENFNAANVMCEFANAGAIKISELITDNDITTIFELLEYIKELQNETLPEFDIFTLLE